MPVPLSTLTSGVGVPPTQPDTPAKYGEKKPRDAITTLEQFRGFSLAQLKQQALQNKPRACNTLTRPSGLQQLRFCLVHFGVGGATPQQSEMMERIEQRT